MIINSVGPITLKDEGEDALQTTTANKLVRDHCLAAAGMLGVGELVVGLQYELHDVQRNTHVAPLFAQCVTKQRHPSTDLCDRLQPI